MKVTNRKLTTIKPYKGNPRRVDDAIEAVAKSIEEFGFRQPIVVDAKGVIIVGHVRYWAAKQLGLKAVPVHVATGLSPEKVRAYRIADNKLGELAEWDEELLAAELQALNKKQVDLTATGFEGPELDRLLAGSAAVDAAADADAGGAGSYKEQYGVIVVCKSARHQKKVFEELQKAGHECRVVCT